MKKVLGLAALVVVAVFAIMPAQASACGRSRWYSDCCVHPVVVVGSCHHYYAYDYGCCHYGRRGWHTGYYVASYQPATYYVAGGTVTTYSSYFSPEQLPAPVAEPNGVTVRLQVPSDARVSFDGKATSQTGTDRVFNSPSLAPGQEFVYQIRVQWTENGKAMDQTRDVKVRAGAMINLTFGA